MAVIATILVLDVRVPKLSGDNLNHELAVSLVHMIPVLGAYIVSFLVVLVFWVAHHHFMHAIVRVDRNLLWLNGLFLLTFALVPAPTELIGRHPLLPMSSFVYGGVMAMCGLCFALMRRYVTLHGALLESSVSRADALRSLRRSWLSPALYGLGALLALADPRIALTVFIAVPLIFIFPGALDRLEN